MRFERCQNMCFMVFCQLALGTLRYVQANTNIRTKCITHLRNVWRHYVDVHYMDDSIPHGQTKDEATGKKYVQ